MASKLDSGSKNYVDHIGGDGSSSQGNSSSFLPTTDWRQIDIYLGDLAAGSHTFILGGSNNKKDAADESTTLVIDDVIITSGNASPANPVQPLVNRLSLNQYLAYNQGVAVYNDRCRMSGCSATDYTNAQNWVMQQLSSMGYTPQKVNFTYSSFSGSNVWATKVGSVHPNQMYIISTHLDGRGGGDASMMMARGGPGARSRPCPMAAPDVPNGCIHPLHLLGQRRDPGYTAHMAMFKIGAACGARKPRWLRAVPTSQPG